MAIINPLLEGVDGDSFRTLDSFPENYIFLVEEKVKSANSLWASKEVRFLESDIDMPDIDSVSPYDYYSDTYRRIGDLLGLMEFYHVSQSNASNTLVFDSLPEWSDAVVGYDNPHYPVFGVVDNGRLLTIYDARNGIEIVVNQVKANPEKGIFNDVTFYTINDMYRGLKQVVYAKKLEDGSHKAGASIIAYDFEKNETKGHGYSITSD